MEHNSLLTLIPYVILGIFPGVIHFYNAWQKFKQKCRYYIFFQPLKTFLFWVWLLIQILVPALIYWWIFITTCEQKPNINLNFVFKVVIYGICFSSLFTNIERMALIPVNLSIVVDWVDNLLKDDLLSQERVKTANFWSNLEKQMKNLELDNLSSGINYLKRHYFDQGFFNENLKEYQYFQNQLEEISQDLEKNTQCEKLISICLKEVIPRQDLPDVLKQFNLPDEFINIYSNQK